MSLFKGGYLEPISVGQPIRTQQIIVTGPDSYAQFQISDGSTFEVFANSRVVFRETPGDWQHLLNVVIGRVKVFIQHLPGVANPNNVTSPTAVISVRGTVFDVIVEDDDTTVVSVDEGVVDVRNLTAPGDSVTLRAGDVQRIYRGQRLVAQKMDKGFLFAKALQAMRDAVLQVALGRPGGVGGGGGTPAPSSGGAQGDKGKTGSTGGTSTTAPPAPPATPPPPPGGGG